MSATRMQLIFLLAFVCVFFVVQLMSNLRPKAKIEQSQRLVELQQKLTLRDAELATTKQKLELVETLLEISQQESENLKQQTPAFKGSAIASRAADKRFSPNSRQKEITEHAEAAVPTPPPTQHPNIPGPPLRYNRELGGQVADRLGVFFNVAAAAATVGRDVYVRWDESAELLSELSSLLQWPTNFHILPRPDFERATSNMSDIEFDVPGLERSMWALDSVYTTAWKTFRLPAPLPPLREHDFARSFRQISKQFALRSPPPPQLPPKPYLVLHVRAPASAKDQFCTTAVLKTLAASGMPLVALSDDPAVRDAVLSKLSPAPAHVIKLPHVPGRYGSTVQDMHALLGATAIIQHVSSGWHALSSVTAMVGGVPLLNTWLAADDKRKSYSIGILAAIARTERLPTELRSGNREDESAEFAERVKKRVKKEWPALKTSLGGGGGEEEGDECGGCLVEEEEGREGGGKVGGLGATARSTVGDQVRFLLVLGPEGASHSYMSAVYKNSSTYRKINAMPGAQRTHIQLQRSLYNHYGKAGLSDWPCKADPRPPAEVFDHAVKSFQRMQRKALLALHRWRRTHPLESAPQEMVVPLNSADDNSAGMGSYPNFPGACRYLQYPDVDAAFEACRAAGVECSILVLLRDPEEVIYSSAVRRRFQEKHSQIKMMAGMLSIIHTQLRNHLDAPHWCWGYGDPDVSAIADAYALDRQFVAQYYAETFAASRLNAEKKAATWQGLHSAEMSALAQATRQVETLCFGE